jgi:hypothetical protein
MSQTPRTPRNARSRRPATGKPWPRTSSTSSARSTSNSKRVHPASATSPRACIPPAGSFGSWWPPELICAPAAVAGRQRSRWLTRALLPAGCGPEPARCAQLVGALGDVIGRLYDELTQSDRWATLIALSSVARRCARLIAASGPYQHVQDLHAVIESAACLRRVAELSPPDPSRCIGLTRPIPVLGLPSRLAPAQVVYETMAEILDLVKRPGRGPVPLRQIAAVCRAAEAVAGAVQPPSPGKASASAADAWHAARNRLSRLTDGSHTAVTNDRLSHCAARVVHAMELVPASGSPDVDNADLAALHRAAALLPALANTLDRELRMMTQPPIGLVADRPLHEGRVNEWLHRRSFVATRDDIAACRAPVTAARKRSEEFRIPFGLSL